MNENIQLHPEEMAAREKERKLNEEALAKQAQILAHAEQVRQDKKARGITLPPRIIKMPEGTDDFKLTPAMEKDKWLMERGLSPQKYKK